MLFTTHLQTYWFDHSLTSIVFCTSKLFPAFFSGIFFFLPYEFLMQEVKIYNHSGMQFYMLNLLYRKPKKRWKSNLKVQVTSTVTHEHTVIRNILNQLLLSSPCGSLSQQNMFSIFQDKMFVTQIMGYLEQRFIV